MCKYRSKNGVIPVSSTGMTGMTPFISMAVFSILFCHPAERILLFRTYLERKSGR